MSQIRLIIFPNAIVQNTSFVKFTLIIAPNLPSVEVDEKSR